jgi:site-specific DNA-methyltransferase (adenine-specific)
VGLDLRNCDCMELMSQFPDGHFDLAIVDPPYGIGIGNQNQSTSRNSKYNNGNRRRLKWVSNWDNETPDKLYFDELFRVSKAQIIWGGNYFLDYLTSTKCVLIWDKEQSFSGADFEMAWTSFDKSSKIFRYARCLMHHYPDGEKRIHPTQKPVELYKWILKNFANEGSKILDTHLGSGSIALACHDYKFDLVASEINKEYFDSTMKRVSNHLAQTVLF